MRVCVPWALGVWQPLLLRTLGSHPRWRVWDLPRRKGVGRAGLGQEGPTWQGPQSLRGPGWEGWVLAGFGLWARAFIRRVS